MLKIYDEPDVQDDLYGFCVSCSCYSFSSFTWLSPKEVTGCACQMYHELESPDEEECLRCMMNRNSKLVSVCLC